MDIGHIKGNGGIERGGRADRRDRPQQTDSSKVPPQDTAAISDSGRETATRVEALTEKLRQDDPARQEIVGAARERLLSGDLDDISVYRNVARELLDNGH